MNKGLVEHLDKPAMNLCLCGFLCIFEIQYMYGNNGKVLSKVTHAKYDTCFPISYDQKNVRAILKSVKSRSKFKMYELP